LAKEWGVSRREIEVALIFLVQRGSLNGEFVGGTDVPVVMEITDVGMEDYEVQVAQNKISLGPVNSVSSSPDARNVFVVHGRDKKLRIDLFSFLRSINLNPLEFSEAIRLTGKAAPYIGEVLDAAFRNAQAVIVLLSPDDEARLRPEFQNANDLPYERELTPQPRQNVLFEAGLAFGYKPNRTILVRVGELRPFSDIYGRHEVRLSNEIENRQDLANRLRNAGCEVKTEGTDWHKLGNFESSLGDVEMKLGVNHLVAYYFTHS
jgi:predicted nucleotide-binding protein